MSETLAPIEAGKSYQLTTFKTLTGLGDHAMRAARRESQKHGITLVRRVHNRAYVRGEDWLSYLAQASE